MQDDFVNIQQQILDNSTLNEGVGDKKYMRFLCLFIWASGKFTEKLIDQLEPDKVHPDLKRDLWEHAVLSNKFLTYAQGIKNDSILVPDGVVRGEAGDIGQKAKTELARVLEGVCLMASGLRVNLRELFRIAKNN